jgi:hypothetical protein
MALGRQIVDSVGRTSWMIRIRLVPSVRSP